MTRKLTRLRIVLDLEHAEFSDNEHPSLGAMPVVDTEGAHRFREHPTAGEGCGVSVAARCWGDAMKAKLISQRKNERTGGTYKHWQCEEGGPLPEYVVTSACVTIDHGPETYVFAADAEGQITDWTDLPGSFIGRLNHERAILGAGYEVQP